MQLVTFVANGERRVGVHVDGSIIDARAALAARFADGGEGRPDELAAALVPADMVAFIERGEPALAQVRSAVDYALARKDESPQPYERRLTYSFNDVGVHAPIINPSKVVAIGLNYLDHAKESGDGTAQKADLLYEVHDGHRRTGRGGRLTASRDEQSGRLRGRTRGRHREGSANVSEDEAMDHVFGYTILNDVSARDLQFEDGQWVKGKSLDTFAPMGPWVVTKDEIADPHDLRIVLALNGEVVQDSSTSNLIFKIPQLIAVLEPSVYPTAR